MQQGIPTEETVLEYFRTLSNWGRWGWKTSSAR
mgnify:CR=1 FL=1